jgi:hypothetical protein
VNCKAGNGGCYRSRAEAVALGVGDMEGRYGGRVSARWERTGAFVLESI